MQSISSVQHSLYINADKASPKKLKADVDALADSTNAKQQAKKQVISVGSHEAMADAEAIFARANRFADVSAKVQKSLQAYEAVEVSMKRDALSQMMGVDIFA